MNLTKKKTTIVILFLTLVLSLGLLCNVSFKSNATSNAETELGKIFIYNHDGNQQGITIEGVPKVPGNLDAVQNEWRTFDAFFGNFLYNGLQAHNTRQTTQDGQYMSTHYNLGGYTYIVNTQRTSPQPGDVMYFKKGFTPIYGTNSGGSVNRTDHALYNKSLSYDRYYVFDGYKFVQTKVLKNLNTSSNYVVANQTLSLTPEFLPINYYRTNPYEWGAPYVGPKTNMWDENEVAKLQLPEHQSTRLSKAIVYESSDPTIATVDANGVVTGKKAGKVTITGTHVDSNEKMSTDIYVRPSATAITPVVSYADGKILIDSGIVSSAVASVSISDNAFFSQIKINGASLAGSEAVALGADGVVSITKTLAENDIIHFETGWQPMTSTDGSTISFVDKSLDFDKYYQIKSGVLQAINVFALPSTEFDMQTREVKTIAPTFIDGISDKDIIWTSSADYMLKVDESGTLQSKNYVSGAENKYKAKGNVFSPCNDDTFPIVTVTATHKATGYSQTMRVSICETIEAMKVEVTLIPSDPKNIGINFIGMESGRKGKSDYMLNIESKYNYLNPEDGRLGSNWNRNNSFFAKGWLNGKMLTNDIFGTNGLYTFTHSRNRVDYSLCMDIQRQFNKDDVIVFQTGYRPFTYLTDYGYFFDSMELKGDMVYRLVDGKFTAESPVVFEKNSYSILTGSSEKVAVKKSKVTESFVLADWTGGFNTNVTYSIEDDSIATVDANGNITAVKEGQTKVIATNGAGLTTTSIIYVFDTPRVELGGDLSLGVSDEVELVASTNDLGGKFTFTSSDASVVKVLKSSKNTVTISAVAYGSATINVSYNDGALTDSINVKVGPNLTFINENNINHLYVNRTARFTATTTSQDATITLSSSDQAKVAIDENGFVTALSAGNATITARCTANGNPSVYTEASFDIVVEDYDVLKIAGLTYEGNKLTINYDKSRSDLIHTYGIHTIAYGETAYEDFNLFFNKILIQENNGTALSLFEYAYGVGTKKVILGQDGKPTNEVRNVVINGDTTYLEFVFGDGTVIAEGTKITFLNGFTPLYGNNVGNYYGKNTMDKAVTYIYEDGVWSLFIPDGGNFTVERISDYKNSIFTMTFNVKTTKNVAGENVVASDKILINGYTMTQINQADPNGVIARHLGKDIAFKIKESVVINGKKIFDFSRSNLLTIKILQGYAMPSSYVAKEDFEKSFYVNEKYWSDPMKEFSSDIKLDIKNVTQSLTNECKTITINFNNASKVFNQLSSIYVNSVPQWLVTTANKDQLDHQISTGAKYATWHGIYINNKTIYDYMFKSGATNIEDQSKIIAINFDYANNALVLVFDKDQANTAKIDWSKEVSIQFDSAIFQTDIGATFDKDVKYVFSPSDSTWSRAYLYTIEANDTLTVEAGATAKINATLVSNPTGGSSTMKYKTSNPEVAIVDANGVVTGISAGEVKITVSAPDDSVSKEITVTVTPAKVVPPPTKGCNGCNKSASAEAGLGAMMLLVLFAGISFRKMR